MWLYIYINLFIHYLNFNIISVNKQMIVKYLINKKPFEVSYEKTSKGIDYN